MKTPKKILVPIDLSDSSVAAIVYAHEVARFFNASLTILNVVDVGDEGVVFPPEALGTKEVRSYLVSKRKGKIKQFLKNFPAIKSSDHKLIVISGSPAREIVTYAKSAIMDLIVMSTHGRSGMPHLILGSVAEKVVRYAECPVLTLKPEHVEGLTPVFSP